MTHLFVFVLSLAGFAMLLLAMARHQQDWLRRKLSPSLSQRLRRGGFALLALAFGTAGSGLGWGYGAVVWFGWLSVTAITVVAANLNRERIMPAKRS